MPGGGVFMTILSAWKEEARLNRCLGRLNISVEEFAIQHNLPVGAVLVYPYGSGTARIIHRILKDLESRSEIETCGR